MSFVIWLIKKYRMFLGAISIWALCTTISWFSLEPIFGMPFEAPTYFLFKLLVAIGFGVIFTLFVFIICATIGSALETPEKIRKLKESYNLEKTKK